MSEQVPRGSRDDDEARRRGASLLRDAQRGRLLSLVEAHSGLVIEDRRRDELDEAVQDLVREQGLASVAGFVEACASRSGPILDRLAARLSVKETHFFRDRGQFAALRSVVLPELLRARESTRTIRIWSAGCATGEEAWSLAMALRDAAAEEGVALGDWVVDVVGTDLDGDLLERARAGEYDMYSFRGVEPAEIERHFEPASEGWRVAADTRPMVRFARLNLKSDPVPNAGLGLSDLDLIACRNVTIYFSDETTRELVSRLHAALRPGGYLVVGHSEHSLEAHKEFETHALPGAIVYRKAAEPGQGEAAIPWSGLQAGELPVVVPEADVRGAGEVAGEGSGSGPLALARAAWQEGDANGAVEQALDVLERRPDDPDACRFLGELAADRGNVLEAQAWLKRAVRHRPMDAEAHHLLAAACAEAGRSAEALEHVERALYIDPDSILGHVLAARLHRADERPEAAERSLRNARALLEKLDDDAAIPHGRGLTAGQLRVLLPEEP